jgi:hypothetical protein
LAAPASIGWATTVNSSPLALGVVVGLLVWGITAIIVCEGMRVSRGFQTLQASANAFTWLEERDSPSPAGHAAPGGTPLLEPSTVQQLTRRQESDGSERIEAVLWARFDAGESESVLHLPIHPLLGAAPHVECEPLDESPVSAAVTAALPYGVRIEVKRPSGIEQCLCVPIGVEIWSRDRAVGVA